MKVNPLCIRIEECTHPVDYQAVEDSGCMSHEGGEVVDTTAMELVCTLCGEIIKDYVNEEEIPY